MKDYDLQELRERTIRELKAVRNSASSEIRSIQKRAKKAAEKPDVREKLMIAAGIVAVAAVTAAVVTTVIKSRQEGLSKKKSKEKDGSSGGEDARQAYFVGGGIAGLSGAVYLIRDCGFSGKNIHIIEAMSTVGGGNSAGGNAAEGYTLRGVRMLHKKGYENFWELLSSIPSIDHPQMSVAEEILTFSEKNPVCSKVRMVDYDGNPVDTETAGLNQEDRMALAGLLMMPERKLENISIREWFEHTPHFFQSTFWFVWQSAFGFRKNSGVLELKRSVNYRLFRMSGAETNEDLVVTPYNQYESIILPIRRYLEKHEVDFITHAAVTDVEFTEDDRLTASAIHLRNNGIEEILDLNPKDLCFVTNGSAVDCMTAGNLKAPAPMCTSGSPSARLWYKLSENREIMGNPENFFDSPAQTNSESFTITLRGNRLTDYIRQFSGSQDGGLLTFKDSAWMLSVAVPAQPHFKEQPEDCSVLWGRGLCTDQPGDYVKKPMRDCTGEEILYELLCHLRAENMEEEIMGSVINVIPCMMPYAGAQLQPRSRKDRPAAVLKKSVNFALIGQFAEVPGDMAFAEEYSVRTARMAVYRLMGVKKKLAPAARRDPAMILKAFLKLYQ